jgi:hypothetical protein
VEDDGGGLAAGETETKKDSEEPCRDLRDCVEERRTTLAHSRLQSGLQARILAEELRSLGVDEAGMAVRRFEALAGDAVVVEAEAERGQGHDEMQF